MKTTVQKKGAYEIFKTTKDHQILSLNDEDWFALVQGEKGDIIVHSDSDHEKEETLEKGQFYLADFEDDPDFNDVPHLLLQQDGDRYRELILPNGLPTKSDHQKKLIRSDKEVSGDTVREHLET